MSFLFGLLDDLYHLLSLFSGIIGLSFCIYFLYKFLRGYKMMIQFEKHKPGELWFDMQTSRREPTSEVNKT